MSPARSRALLLAAVVGLGAAAPGSAAAQVPPDEAWRTLETAHFRITFPEHLAELAEKAGNVAEQAHESLSAGFRAGPTGTIDIVLTDHVDVSNGFARYSPSNRIVLYARPPADHLALAYFDDWLEQLVVHELAHVFHLDYGGAFGGFFRAVLGRQPAPGSILTFPGRNVPGWVIEGLATWYESALTAGGRVHGTYHEMVLRTAALEGRFETLGQAGGNSPQWPGGGRRYIYGSLFFEHLLDKHGRDRMAEFVQDVVRTARLPSRVLDDVSLTDEWGAWTDEMHARVERLDADLARFGPITEPEALTRGARQGLHSAVSPDGGSLVYVRSDGRSDPRLVAMPPAGGDASTLARTNHLTRFDFLPGGGIVFAQREYADRYRQYSDLHVLTPDGSVRRVTEDARVTAPSAGPGGSWAVAVADGAGTNRLVRVDLGNGALEEIAAPVAATYWAWPAVSPDGRWIAASRWAEGRHDVVILDRDGRVVHAVTHDRALDMAPAWSADGRHLVWSSDRTGIPNILAVEVDARTGAAGPPRLLTNVRTGAAFPSVDPAGEWLYFSGYHVDGWEIERLPFAPHLAPPAPEPAARFDDHALAPATPAAALADNVPATATAATTPPDDVPAAPAAAGSVQAADGVDERKRSGVDDSVRGYSPLSTLRPTYWYPQLRAPLAIAEATVGDVEVPRTEVLGRAFGGRTEGFDLVGRHAYAVGASVFTSGGKREGDVSYEYRGLGNPTIGLAASQTWGHDGARVGGATGAEGSPETFFILERRRRMAASVRIRRPGYRTSVGLTFSAGLVRSDREVLDTGLQATDAYGLARPGATSSELAVALDASTARSHAFQMGNARGAAMSLRARTRRDLDVPAGLAGRTDVDRSADDLVGRLRAYLPVPGPGFAASVLAVRANAGAARGPATGTGYFSVGGDLSFFAVRGHDAATRAGTRAWSASLEYRAPLVLINRGPGVWGLHLDRVFGSAFIDTGDAWGAGSAFAAEPSRRRPLVSFGVELTTDLLVFYQAPLRLRLGMAAIPDPDARPGGASGASPWRRVFYVGVGVPF